MPNLNIFQGLTGRQGSPTGGSVRSMIVAAFGTTSRGGPNTRAAAQELGVSQRSVQRWIAGEDRKQRSKPRADHLSTLRTSARQAATTKKGRKASLDKARSRFANRKSARLTTHGMQGPEGGGTGYSRQRTVTVELGANDIDAMFDAYEKGGDAAVTQWLEQHHSANYVPGWTFEGIDTIGIE
ncbi:hypothetical protein [Brachybacterium kimchii]|uniref:Terminal protein n=1 Tax=Brachybacterium kimchii TaxID=2942909 RepID=A0ABY4NB72_9MICO|nr:hypothetical protein [Brachybacterium kimchii]UQN31787.1 hypothetical protein M4486_19550 [Brachybacterium kimchii]